MRRAALLVLAPAAGFGVLALLAAAADRRLGGDEAVMSVLNGLVPVSSDDVHIDPFLDVTALLVTGLVALVGLVQALRGEWRVVLYLLVAIAMPVLLSRVFKELVARPAIEGPRDAYTFPSGSATWCMATVAALALLAAPARERRVVVWAGAALLVVYGAVIAWEEWHHPSDVLGGWLLGVAGAGAAWLALRRPRAALRGDGRGVTVRAR